MARIAIKKRRLCARALGYRQRLRGLGLAQGIHDAGFQRASRCPLSRTTRAPCRRTILDPRLGAHVLCFELSDERSETRWERCRECARPVRYEAALGSLGCCGSRFPLLLGC